MKSRFILLAVLLLALASSELPASGAESEDSGWFVIRDRESGDCWTGKLIRIDGQLASGKDQVAGGPFAGKDAAEAHLARLVERGTCRED